MTDIAPPKRPKIDVASSIVGNDITLLEVLLHLHDTGVVNKDKLAARLESGANSFERQFNELGKNGAAVAFSARQMAYMLRSAVAVDEEGNPV